MPTDPDIQAQIYQSFLVEAPELLTAIEQELFDLMENRTLERVHTLMRHAHTLKGAAASVERHLIKNVSHHLEDAFKALYDPQLELDAELGSLLWEGFECLRLPLSAELMGTPVDESEVLNRTATVFARMQEKMGDFFGKETPMLESSDLGHDWVSSVVQESMPEEIDQLRQLIAAGPSSDLSTVFEGVLTQAEWFQGMAESYQLTGMTQIAQMAIQALERQPDQALAIARVLLSDLRTARLQILEGDPQAGSASAALIAFAEGSTTASSPDLDSSLDSSVVSEADLTPTDPRPSDPPQVMSWDPFASFGSHRFESQVELQTDGQLEPQIDPPLEPEIPIVEPESTADVLPSSEISAAPFGLLDQLVSGYSPEPQFQDHPEDLEPLPLDSIDPTSMDPIAQSDPLASPDDRQTDPVEADLSTMAGSMEDLEGDPVASSPAEPTFGLLDQLVSGFSVEEAEAESESEHLFSQEAPDPESMDPVPSPGSIDGAFDGSFDGSINGSIDLISSTTSSDLSLSPNLDDLVANYESDGDPTPESDPRPQVWEDPPAVIPNSDLAITVPTSPPAPVTGTAIDQLLQAIGTNATPAPQTPSNPPPPPPSSAPVPTDPAQSIRVDLRLLDRLNQGVGELLITQDQQSLQAEQLHQRSRELQRWIDLCQQRITQAQDRANRRSRQSRLAAHRSSTPDFDQLEMDTYTDLHVLLQSALEALVQVREGMDSVTQYSQTTHLTLKRQRQVLSGAQADLLQARMVPLGVILNRFPRVLQQLSTLYHKSVELKLQGTQVLVDKAIAEKLYDPLLHLIRNAFSHGIEDREGRRQQGKSDTGTIQMRAYHQGNRTTIEIQDDGQGLQWERIRQRGVERGLLNPQRAQQVTPAQLIELLFQPGFSTATEVNDLSGRGVGLDAVRAQLQAVQGTISVRSEPGQGTTFILQLPLTLTTARLLVCHDRDISYALLSDSIEQILLPQADQIRSTQGQDYLWWDREGTQQLLPIHALSDLIDYRYRPFLHRSSSPSTSPFALALGRRSSISPLLIIRWGSQQLCLRIDQVIGEQELVIKTLGRRPRLPSYIQGYSVLGNGRLAMVMDTQELIRERWQQGAQEISGILPVTLAQHPLASGSGSEPQAQASLSKGSATLPTSPSPTGVILVVDDSATQRQSVVLSLQKAGHSTLQAVDGQDAIEKLEAHPEIQAVVCDIEMPRANGFEVLGYCRRDSRLQAVPIVMLTSRSGAKHRQKALELGASGYLTKPYSDRELLDLLNAHVSASAVT